MIDMKDCIKFWTLESTDDRGNTKQETGIFESFKLDGPRVGCKPQAHGGDHCRNRGLGGRAQPCPGDVFAHLAMASKRLPSPIVGSPGRRLML